VIGLDRVSRARAQLDGLAPGAAAPILLLTALFFFDEFDTQAFATFGKEIEADFGISDSTLVSLTVANIGITLLLATAIGYLGDRRNRMRMCVVFAFVAAAFSGATALASLGGVALLAVVRFGNGVGRLVNDTVHNSLLADWTPVRNRPAVYAFHSSATTMAAVAGPATVAVLGTLGTYRLAFIAAALPVILLALRARRVPEPARGQADVPVELLDIDLLRLPAPLTFRQSVRASLQSRTLRWQYSAWFVVGAGFIPIIALLPLFLSKEYGASALLRGAVGTAGGIAMIIGIVISARWGQRLIARDLAGPLTVSCVALATVSGLVALLSVTPTFPHPLVCSIGVQLVAQFVTGLFAAPYYATLSLVAPPRARSTAYGLLALVLVLGAVVLYIGTGVAQIADRDGIRAGLLATAPFFLGAALLLFPARRHVAADNERGLQSVMALAQGLADPAVDGQAAPSAFLQIRDVDVSYGPVQVLFGVDVEVARGEVVALLGTNGAGKSTLLKAVSGLLPVSGGTVTLDGEDVTRYGAARLARSGVVQVPGGKAVFPTLTVAEHFASSGWLYGGMAAAEVQARTDAVLERFPRVRERWGQRAGDLSGGEQQQLALGMAFVAKPRLLIIDELSLGLAPAIVETLLGMVRAIHAEGCTIILVEQSVNVALTVADRAYYMEKGQVRFSGPTAELLERPDVLRSVFLAGAEAGFAEEARRSPATTVVPVAADVEAPAGTGPALEVAGLTKSFGGVHAVRDVSFAVGRGEVLGLIGPNGAGKTTVFDLITGVLDADAGSLHLATQDISRWTAARRSRAGLGRSFQDARIFPSLTVAENVALGLDRHIPVRDHLAAALALPSMQESEIDVAYTVDDLIELLQLGDFRDRFVSELSTGSRRVVDLAMAIAHAPDVLLLDEPSSGIAQRETEALGPLLLRIRDETGCALLVIEHDMPLLRAVSDEVLALELGAVVTRGTAEEVLADPRVIASYLGGDTAVVQRSGLVVA